MWRVLHTFRQAGQHFRRQAQIGRYYADFACHEAKIVVEVDGDTHGTTAEYDAERDRHLRWRGYAVLRFSNHDVMHNAEGVFAVIAAAVSGTTTPTPDPSPQGGGRRSRRTQFAHDTTAVSPSPLRGGVRGGGSLDPVTTTSPELSHD
jgi:very-short-patch-repair endonuclease